MTGSVHTSAPLRVIDLARGHIRDSVAAAILALQASDAMLYDRGGMLVRPVVLGGADHQCGIHRRGGALVLRAVTSTWLAHELARVATWQRYDARARSAVVVDVPDRIAATIVDAPDLGAWPTLRGVIRAPLVLPDGRIIAKPGYDERSGLLADWNGGAWSLPDAPTRDDAGEALTVLEKMFRHYQWLTKADCAVAVSLIITAIQRPALIAAPLHGASSPEPGSGKSLLVDAASIIATGAPAAVMDWGDDDAEAAKRLDAVMIAGDSILAIDNVERPLGGAALCQILTQSERRIRPLGASIAVSVPCTALVTATACNLIVRGDLVRRAIICRIDPRTERPELRQIGQDLLGEARERRREFVCQAITIVAAYLVAGCPDVGLPPLGGYGDWSRMVRSAIVWAGGADPCSTMDRLRADDPDRATMRAVYRAWRLIAGDAPQTAAQLLGHADTDITLRDALALIDRRGITVRSLGIWCRTHRDRSIDGLTLSADGVTRAGVVQWIVR